MTDESRKGDDMKANTIQTVTGLLAHLHACPEVSGQETRTKLLLQKFLRCHTTLELRPCGDGFYAAHREASGQKPALALRADYDALALPEGGAAHLCGHDGHAAALCGAALELEGRTVGRNVFLLFQPAEETGAGAAPCCDLFRRENVDEIYGAHNLPGLPLGQVTTRSGTFACASCGLTLRFRGAAAHAAYPENGVSPAGAVGRLLCSLPELAASENGAGMVLCTVIGVQMGEKAFGTASADGEVWLTLRGEHTADLERLKGSVVNCAGALAQAERLTFDWEEQDAFPATENTPACAEKVLQTCGGVELPVPMRWSEDFGHYLRYCPGAFFGIGAGEGCAPLHTAGYRYPEILLQPSIEAWMRLILK